MMIIMSLRRDSPLNFARIQGPPCVFSVVWVRDQIPFGSGTRSHACENVIVCMGAFESRTELHSGQGPNRILIQDQIVFRSGTQCVCV